jgi:hypothetical protein
MVDNEAQLKIYMEILDQLPEVKALVAWGIETLPENAAKDSRIFTFKDFLQLGSKVDDAVIENITAK